MMDTLRRTGRIVSGLLVALLLSPIGTAKAEDKVRFATNWKAQAAHGGFYQAIADGARTSASVWT